MNGLNWWKGIVKREYIKYYGDPSATYPQPPNIGEIKREDLAILFDVPHLFLADSLWTVVDIAYVDKFVQLNPVSEERYIAQLHDCDDFSQELVVDLKRWVKGLAAFEVWLKSRAHSQVVVADIEEALWIYEGQSDRRTPCDVDDISFLR